MSGRIDFLTIALITIAIGAAVTDLWRGRIYNAWTVPALVLGLIYSTFGSQLLGTSGVGIGSALQGVGVGLGLFGILFALRVIGGGDVKLLMALGAWGGLDYTLRVATLSIVLGGVLAVGVLLVKGRLFKFLHSLKRFVVSILIRELEIETPAIDWSLQMPFGAPMAIAAIWCAVNPL